MKNIKILFILFFILGTISLFGREEKKFYRDSILYTGDIFTTYEIKFDAAQAILLPGCYSYLDSLATYILNHSSLIISMNVYADQLPLEKENSELTQQRADAIDTYLITKGISPKKIHPHGYGSVPTTEIINAKTQEEKDKLHWEYERVEFEIIGATLQFTDSYVVLGSKMIASPIRFTLNGDSLLPVCYPFLDSTAAFLRAHPTVIMEIGAYTDLRQSEQYCSNLSMKRGRSVAKYLIKKGVSGFQLLPKGYGNTRPLRLEDGTVLTEKYIMSKESKEEREKLFGMNRRVEFKLIDVLR